MKYKFIEDTEFAFGRFSKGDIIEYNETLDAWGHTEEHEDICAVVTLSESIVEKWIAENRLIPVEMPANCQCQCKCEKLDKVKAEVDKLLETYEKNYNELIEQYNEGDVPPCIKVEAETVYFNLTKVLNTIKDLLNE